MLDIQVYRETLEAVDAAGGGETVKVGFRILDGHNEASEAPIIT